MKPTLLIKLNDERIGLGFKNSDGQTYTIDGHGFYIDDLTNNDIKDMVLLINVFGLT